MERSTLITFLLTNVSKEDGGLSPYRFFVFGSLLRGNCFNDIDILIVYDRDKTKLSKVLALRRKLRCAFWEQFNIELDVCLLSLEEAAGNSFISDESACHLLG
jgi:predicted nucleotidyltransferase